MARFLGYRSVIADLRKHKLGTGKVVSGTLKTRATGDTMTSVTWKHIYIWPQPERTGVGGAGYPNTEGRMTMWRVGEAVAPRPDAKLAIGSTTYQIREVTPRLNADEDRNFAVYDLVTT